MNIEIVDDSVTKVIVEKKLMMNGAELGFIKEMKWDYPDAKFHAGLEIKLNDLGSSKTLIQGYGPDPQAAIQNAIDTGLDYHRQSLAAIEKLADQIK